MCEEVSPTQVGVGGKAVVFIPIPPHTVSEPVLATHVLLIVLVRMVQWGEYTCTLIVL